MLFLKYSIFPQSLILTPLTPFTSRNCQHKMSTLSNSVISPANVEPAIDEPSDTRIESHQDISARNISPAKLTAMLRTKFGIGAYEIQVYSTVNNLMRIGTNDCFYAQMIRNVYNIRAPRRLSLNEIAECRWKVTTRILGCSIPNATEDDNECLKANAEFTGFPEFMGWEFSECNQSTTTYFFYVSWYKLRKKTTWQGHDFVSKKLYMRYKYCSSEFPELR